MEKLAGAIASRPPKIKQKENAGSDNRRPHFLSSFVR